MLRALCILGLFSLSCSSSADTRQPAGETARTAPPPAATEPQPPAAPADAAPLAATPPAADPDAPCATDSDCAFNNPCDPQRCVAAASVPHSPGCKESAPPTGTCLCFENRCALKPGPTHPAVAVETDCDYTPGCVLDRAAGRCAPGKDDDFRADRSIGPRCDCDSHVPRRCHFSWLDPVPCTSVDDCWVEHLPYTHPIKRPRSKKGRRFRPCKDGESAPACTAGRCTLLAYGC